MENNSLKDDESISRMDTFPIMLDEKDNFMTKFNSIYRYIKRKLKENRLIVYSGLLVVLLVFLIVFSVCLARLVSFNYILKDLRDEFARIPVSNTVTIDGYKNEDHVLLVAEALYSAGGDYVPSREVLNYVEFNNFNSLYKRKHVSWTEKKMKFLAFRENLTLIEEHNKIEDKTYTLKMNKFGDMTNAEFMSCCAGNNKLNDYFKSLGDKINVKTTPRIDVGPFKSVMGTSSTYVDYRTHNLLPPIKDQGNSCGSCWAFATISPIEALYAKKNKTVTTFSEQQLIDCVTDCSGCNGGVPTYSYQYAKDNGVYHEKDYPYTATENTCVDVADKTKFKIGGFSVVFTPDLVGLLHAYGPLTTAVSVSVKWKFYHRGVINECGNIINHALTLVGIGKNEDGEYYILRNSWGADWGDNGYAYLKKESEDGLDCGLTQFAFFPY